MSILNVNTIQPIGSGTTVTVAATELKTSNFITVGTGASITSPSANVLTLGTNTAERLRITSSGSIAIGVNSPSDKLHVGGNNAFIRVDRPNGNPGLTLIYNSTNSTRGDIDLTTGGDLRFATNNSTERFRIRSDGRVTIGTQTINTNSMLSIHRGSSDESQIRFTNTTTGEGGNNGLLVGIDINEHGRIFNQENTPLRFGTDNTERLRIRAQGPHLLIGTGGDATYNEITESSSNAGLVIGSSSMGNGGIVIRNSTSGTGRIYFADNSGSDPGRQRGQINYYHNGDYMMFATAGSERLRISSNGQLITQGNNNGNPVGMELRNNNTAAYSHAELKLTSQNATTSKIWCDVPNSGMRLNYNGGTSVKINQSGNLVMANGAGIDFSAAGNASGMSSELLDDYEEGTWTPTITGLGNHNNNAGSTWGKYTKIGNRVFITFRYQWTSRTTTNGGVVFLGSLPFSAPNDSKSDAVYIGGLEGVISNSGREVYGGQVVYNTNTIQFRASGHNTSENSLFGSLSTSMSSGYIYGGANYIV